MDRRKGGTGSVIFYILFLVVFSLVVLQRVLPWEFNSAGNGNSYKTTTTDISDSTTGNLRSNSCTAGGSGHAQVPSIPQDSRQDILAADSSSIYLLPTLPLDSRANTNAELLNFTWWNEVSSSAGRTILGMPQNLYWGLLNNSEAWHAYLLQAMPDPPSWSSGGVVTAIRGQVIRLQSNATTSGNSSLAKTMLWNYVTGQSGRGLAGLDFFTAGSLSALKTYFETHDSYLALCATFPGQMAELFVDSFDPSIPSDQRAYYFGQLLAIAALTTVLAGHDQFDVRFQGVLRDSGLLDNWQTIKPLLADIATTVSSRAVALTLAIAEKVAKHFPLDRWAPDYTTFRIDAMVDVLREAGVPKDIIEQKVAGLAQVADGAGSPDGVGDAADGISYDDGSGIRLVIDSKNQGQLFTETGAMEKIRASFLEGRVPGFKAGTAALLKVTYQEVKATVYHYYSGGD